MFLGPLIALLVIAVLAVVALCSGHIPWLRDLAGGAPLEREETPRCAGCIGCGGPDCIERPENKENPS